MVSRQVQWEIIIAGARAAELDIRLYSIVKAQKLFEGGLSRVGFPKERFNKPRHAARYRGVSSIVQAAESACRHFQVRFPRRDIAELVRIRNQIAHDDEIDGLAPTLSVPNWRLEKDGGSPPSPEKAVYLCASARDIDMSLLQAAGVARDEERAAEPQVVGTVDAATVERLSSAVRHAGCRPFLRHISEDAKFFGAGRELHVLRGHSVAHDLAEYESVATAVIEREIAIHIGAIASAQTYNLWKASTLNHVEIIESRRLTEHLDNTLEAIGGLPWRGDDLDAAIHLHTYFPLVMLTGRVLASLFDVLSVGWSETGGLADALGMQDLVHELGDLVCNLHRAGSTTELTGIILGSEWEAVRAPVRSTLTGVLGPAHAPPVWPVWFDVLARRRVDHYGVRTSDPAYALEDLNPALVELMRTDLHKVTTDAVSAREAADFIARGHDLVRIPLATSTAEASLLVRAWPLLEDGRGISLFGLSRFGWPVEPTNLKAALSGLVQLKPCEFGDSLNRRWAGAP